MKMKFDKEKSLKLYNLKLAEVSKKHKKEIKELEQKHAQNGTFRSGSYPNSLIEKYSEHLLEKSELKLESYLDFYGGRVLINDVDKEVMLKELNEFFNRENETKKGAIEGVLHSIGENSGAFFTACIRSINEMCLSARSLYIDKLAIKIEENNFQAKEYIANNGFWNKKSGIIAAISAVVVAVMAILAFLYQINLFPFHSVVDKSNSIITINELTVDPEVVKKGDKTKITWDVSNVDSIKIGNYSTENERDSLLITPQNSARYSIKFIKKTFITEVHLRIIVIDSSKNAL